MATDMQIFGWSMPWFLDAAFLLTAAAFLLRDILWLRVLTVCANIFLIFSAYHAATGPMWPNIYYYLGLIGINGLHAAYVIYERRLTHLSAAEQRVYDSAFRSLDRAAVKKLLRTGEWLTLDQGAMLARAGQVAERVFMIVDGEAAVRHGNRTIAGLALGNFVGEISYLTDGPSSADVVAQGTTRCIAWNRHALRRLLGRDKDLHSVMYAAFGADLSAKLAAHNVRLSEV